MTESERLVSYTEWVANRESEVDAGRPLPSEDIIRLVMLMGEARRLSVFGDDTAAWNGLADRIERLRAMGAW